MKKVMILLSTLLFSVGAAAYEDDGSYEDGYFWAVVQQGNLRGPTIQLACEAFKASNAYKDLKVEGTKCYACRYGNFQSNGKCPFPKYPYETLPDHRTVAKYGCDSSICTWGPPQISCPAENYEVTLTQSFPGSVNQETGEVVEEDYGGTLTICANQPDGVCVFTTQYNGCVYKYRPFHSSTRVYCYPPEGDGKPNCYREFVARSTGEAGSTPIGDEDTSFFIEDEGPAPDEIIDADDPPADTVTETVTADSEETMADGTVVEQDGWSLVSLTGAGLAVQELIDVIAYTYSEGIKKTEDTTVTTTTHPDGSVTETQTTTTKYDKPDETTYTVNKDNGQINVTETPGYSGGSTTTTTDQYDSTGKKISSNTTKQQTGDTKGKNPEKDLACKENPNDPSCQGESGLYVETSVKFSGCEEQAYACEDDAVACAAFRLKLEQECRQLAEDQRQSEYMEEGLRNADEVVTDTLDDARHFMEGLNPDDFLPEFDSYEDALKVAPACPPPYPISTGIYQDTISFQPMCDFAQDYRPALLLIATIAAAFWFVRIASRTQINT